MTTPSLSEKNATITAKIERRVRWACVFALVALALIAFSLVVPRPLPVIVAMSVAQGIGTLSLLIFMQVVVRDVWLAMGSRISAARSSSPGQSSPPQ